MGAGCGLSFHPAAGRRKADDGDCDDANYAGERFAPSLLSLRCASFPRNRRQTVPGRTERDGPSWEDGKTPHAPCTEHTSSLRGVALVRHRRRESSRVLF